MNKVSEIDNIVKKLLFDDAKIDDLLSRLDGLAREVSGFEYGLPMYDDAQKDRMRKAVIKWIASL